MSHLRPRQAQRGQALVETALIAPVLILLVFGSLYISYAFMQRSLMNGVAFMAARSTAVRKGPEAETWAERTRTRLIKRANLSPSHWLNQARFTARGGAGQGRIALEAPKGKLWTLVAHLAAIPAGGGDQTSVTVAMAPEYVDFGKRSGRPPTGSVIDYTIVEPPAYQVAVGAKSGLVGLVLKPFMDVNREADKRIFEPDRHERSQRPDVAPGSAGMPVARGNIDNQLGADADYNTYWLEMQKWDLGLAKGRPGGEMLNKRQNGTMQALKSIDAHYQQLTAGAQGMQNVLNDALAGPLGKIVKFALDQAADAILTGVDVTLKTQENALLLHQKALQP